MADEHRALTKAFSGLGGLGVDELAMVKTISKWHRQPDQKSKFRKNFPGFFMPNGNVEICEDDYVRHLKTEFSRFKNIMVVWAMHPYERDARWMHHVLHKSHPFTIIIEIACTRSSDELLGTRKAYQSLFHHSLEEDVSYHIKENYSKLLVGLVSSYRYEGPKIDNEMAKLEAKSIHNAIKSSGSNELVKNEEIVRILTTRSKLHLKTVFEQYKKLYGKPIAEDLGVNLCLQETVKCIDAPANYFSEVINNAFSDKADKPTKRALNRVIISRSDVDMDMIKEAYNKRFGAKLEDVIAKNTHGCYKDALISLVGK